MSNISFYLFFILTFLSTNFLCATLRLKFILFVLIVIICAVWGFLYNLDGMILILLTAEFTIFLFFLMTYIQLYEFFSFFPKNRAISWAIFFFFFFYINNLSSNITLNYVSFYQSISHVVSSDFFILYYLLFDVLPLVTVIVTLVIGLFSLFFIALYFNLKIVKLMDHKELKNINFLRKQNLIKQTNFKSKVYTFQN
jgi:hypothetical protein